jgi:hypothetical protein
VSPLELQACTVHLSLDELTSPLTCAHSTSPGHVGNAGTEMADTATSRTKNKGTWKFKDISSDLTAYLH